MQRWASGKPASLASSEVRVQCRVFGCSSSVQHLQRAAVNVPARHFVRKGPQAFSSGQSRSWRKWVPTALPPSQPEGPGADAVGTKVQDGQDWKEPQHQPDAAHQNGTNGAVHASAPDAAAAAGLAPIYEKGLPHRWRITFMMAVAFVLCNMDKVCHSQGLQHSLDLATADPRLLLGCWACSPSQASQRGSSALGVGDWEVWQECAPAAVQATSAPSQAAPLLPVHLRLLAPVQLCCWLLP
jgi:hypothetical protein